jgi:tripartite-type tricarboxylate transporter receptor subunit TctC
LVSLIIDNRSGASGNVAAVEVARNGSDGRTFLVNVTTLESVNPLMFERMPIQPAMTCSMWRYWPIPSCFW